MLMLNDKLKHGCDLHLGDSRLQYESRRFLPVISCDLHLGDSRLQ